MLLIGNLLKNINRWDIWYQLRKRCSISFLITPYSRPTAICQKYTLYSTPLPCLHWIRILNSEIWILTLNPIVSHIILTISTIFGHQASSGFHYSLFIRPDRCGLDKILYATVVVQKNRLWRSTAWWTTIHVVTILFWITISIFVKNTTSYRYHNDIQLLGFADASIKNYATTVYLHIVHSAGDIFCTYIYM